MGEITTQEFVHQSILSFTDNSNMGCVCVCVCVGGGGGRQTAGHREQRPVRCWRSQDTSIRGTGAQAPSFLSNPAGAHTAQTGFVSRPPASSCDPSPKKSTRELQPGTFLSVILYFPSHLCPKSFHERRLKEGCLSTCSTCAHTRMHTEGTRCETLQVREDIFNKHSRA